MDNIELRTDVVASGILTPLSQFRGKPRFMGLLSALLTEVQELETAVVESIAARYLANATDWALDQIGELVGLPRPTYGAAATDDDAYKILIYGQIGANISHGTLPELYDILRSLQCTQVRLYEVYPAALTVNLIGTDLTATYDVIRPTLERATHPIEFDIVQHSEHPFGFEGDSSAFGFDDGELGASE